MKDATINYQLICCLCYIDSAFDLKYMVFDT